MGEAHAAGRMIRTTCQSADSTIVGTATVRRHGLRPSYGLAVRRSRAARASVSSTGSVCDQLRQASVIDTP